MGEVNATQGNTSAHRETKHKEGSAQRPVGRAAPQRCASQKADGARASLRQRWHAMGLANHSQLGGQRHPQGVSHRVLTSTGLIACVCLCKADKRKGCERGKVAGEMERSDGKKVTAFVIASLLCQKFTNP